jgi:hypothetical protein
MNKSVAAVSLGLLALAACCAGALAQSIKLPVQSDDQGTVYVAPNVAPTETSAHTQGATIGVQRPDGSGAYTGVDTSTPRPTYSVGASTGGNVSFSAGVNSDGKSNKGATAGVTIKY